MSWLQKRVWWDSWLKTVHRMNLIKLQKTICYVHTQCSKPLDRASGPVQSFEINTKYRVFNKKKQNFIKCKVPKILCFLFLKSAKLCVTKNIFNCEKRAWWMILFFKYSSLGWSLTKEALKVSERQFFASCVQFRGGVHQWEI